MPYDFRYITTKASVSALVAGAVATSVAVTSLLGILPLYPDYGVALLIPGVILLILGVLTWPKGWWRS